MKSCTQCGSDKIIDDAKIEDRLTADRRGPLEVLIGYRSVGALLPDRPERFALRARVCGECGFAEMFVADPAKAWAAWKKVNRSS